MVRRRYSGLAAALGLLGPLTAGAQQVETYAYAPAGGPPATVVVHLDSVAILPVRGMSDSVAAQALTDLGHPVDRTLAGHVMVTPAQVAAGPGELMDYGRDLVQNNAAVVRLAGPLARFSHSPELAFMLSDQVAVRWASTASEGEIAAVRASFKLDVASESTTDSLVQLLRISGGAPDPFYVVDGLLGSGSVDWAYLNTFGGAAGTSQASGPAWGSNSTAPATGPATGPLADPLAGRQWHLPDGGGGIDAEGAWTITEGSSAVVIAIVEHDGFDVTHPDLSGKLWNNPGETADPLTDGDGNGYLGDLHGLDFAGCWDAASTCGQPDLMVGLLDHGTAVAGLAGAEKDNGQGVRGVCPGCPLMLVAVGWGADDWGAWRAIEYAWSEGASVINLSWTKGRTTLLEQAMVGAATWGRGGKGTVVVNGVLNYPVDVCASGWDLMSAVPEAIAVSGSTNTDARVWKTGFGGCLDLMAPAAEQDKLYGVTTTDQKSISGYNTDHPEPSECLGPEVLDPDYTACFGGASAATAQVSGVAGLVLSVDPTLTRGEVYDILITTAEKFDCATAQYDGWLTCPPSGYAWSDTHGYGRVDAFAAVQAAQEAPCPEPTCPDCPECPACPEPSCPACPECDSGGGGDGAEGDVGTVGVEVGARLGYTSLSGSADQDIWNTPGSGPMGDAVLHATVVTPAFLTAKWMLELQVGTSSRSQPTPAEDETLRTLAAQVALLWPFGNYQTYVGFNWANRRHDDGLLTVTTTSAWGAALGMRRVLFGHLPIRLETRWRDWDDGTDEVGLAAIVGVLF